MVDIHAFIPAYGSAPFLKDVIKSAEMWASSIFVATHNPFAEQHVETVEDHSIHVVKKPRPYMKMVNEGWQQFSNRGGYAIILGDAEIVQHHNIMSQIVKELPERATNYMVYFFQDEETYFTRCEYEPREELKGFPLRSNSGLIWWKTHLRPSYSVDLQELGSTVTNIANLNRWGEETESAIMKPWHESGFFNVA